MDEWINLEERRPPPMTWIQIMNEEWGMWGTGMCCGGIWFFKDDYTCKHLPTHWMPINKQTKDLIYE